MSGPLPSVALPFATVGVCWPRNSLGSSGPLGSLRYLGSLASLFFSLRSFCILGTLGSCGCVLPRDIMVYWVHWAPGCLRVPATARMQCVVAAHCAAGPVVAPCAYPAKDTLAERLRRRPAKSMGSPPRGFESHRCRF